MISIMMPPIKKRQMEITNGCALSSAIFDAVAADGHNIANAIPVMNNRKGLLSVLVMI
jgi:hypothetical protein